MVDYLSLLLRGEGRLGGIAVGNLFPQQQERRRQLHRKQGQQPRWRTAATEQWFRNSEVGFNVSWELDIWGRFRRSIEAADADLEASVADFDDVLVVLLADVAANYVQYRTFQERIARRPPQRGDPGAVVPARAGQVQAGAATERDVQQARQVLEQTRALIPQLEARRGRRPTRCACCSASRRTTWPRGSATTATIPTAPPELALGIPADLLRRRPDVRRFERQAAAQSALIGVAKADLYPRLLAARQHRRAGGQTSATCSTRRAA